MRKIQWIINSLLMTLLLSSTAYSQAFWFGNPIAEFLDPNTYVGYELMADIYHDFLADYVVPELRSGMRAFNNNPENDEGVTIYEPEKCWKGYTLLSSMAGYQPDPNGPMYNALLIDMEGNIVHKWSFTRWGVPMKMLPGGYVIGGTAPPDFEGHPTQLDWDGNVVWEVDLHQHHDHQREGNPVGYYVPGMESMVDSGKTLFLDQMVPDPNLTTHISDFPLLDQVIWEVDWDGNVTWQWHAWEHFEQMGFDEAAKEAIRTSQPRFFSFPDATDYLHTNCVSWLGPNKWYDQGDLRFHPDNVILDHRMNNIAFIVARHDHPEGEWVSGDIVWKIGPDYSYRNTEYKLGQIIGMHHAHMVPRGLPGEGNILIFDNGGTFGFGALVPGSTRGTFPNRFRDFSRVIEFDPVTLNMVWEWKQPEPTADYDGDGDIKGIERKFFSSAVCNAQRLVNGNTMICEGDGGRVFEVTNTRDVVWEYIAPQNEPDSRGRTSNQLYRAYRVPYSWVPQLAGN